MQSRRLLALGAMALATAACSGGTSVLSTTSSPTTVASTSTTLAEAKWKVLTVGRAEIRVPRSWLVIDFRAGGKICTSPRAPGTVWVGKAPNVDCPYGLPGGAPRGATIVDFARALGGHPARQSITGTISVNGITVYDVDWHLGALYYQLWLPGHTIGYSSTSLAAGVAAQGPMAQKIISTFGPISPRVRLRNT